MRARPRVLTGSLLTLTLLVGGCGGSSEPDEATPTEPASTPTESPSSTPSDTGSEGYLPKPEGVTLTSPGTGLELEETAVAAWSPRQDLVGVVEVTVVRIDETTVQASLAAFDLDREAQRSTPYFVRTRVTNVGDTDLGARQLPLYVRDDRGVLIPPTGVAPDFERCPGGTLPAVFAPGDRAKSCLIFLVPEGAALKSVMFRPPEGIVPLQWTGPVSSFGDAGVGRDPDRGRGRNSGRDPDRDRRGDAD